MSETPTVLSCCCVECGNCTRAPLYDERKPCCCSVCDHCFRPMPRAQQPFFQQVPPQQFQTPAPWAQLAGISPNLGMGNLAINGTTTVRSLMDNDP